MCEVLVRQMSGNATNRALTGLMLCSRALEVFAASQILWKVGCYEML